MSEETTPALLSADQLADIRTMIRDQIAAMFRQAIDTNRPFGQIAAALATAQGEFLPITRSREVEVQMKSGGKYKFRYAPLDEVINATRPALSKNLIALIQIVTGVVGRDLRIHTKLLHASGELLDSVVDVKRPDEVQQLGSIITYIRRYTITAILGVASEDDDDGNAADGNDRANDRGGGQRQPSGPRTFVELLRAITTAPDRSYLDWLAETEIAGELTTEQRGEARAAAIARTEQLSKSGGKPATMADEIAERERAKAAAKAAAAAPARGGKPAAAPVTISCRECGTEIKVNGLVIDATAVGDMCGRCCAQAEGRR